MGIVFESLDSMPNINTAYLALPDDKPHMYIQFGKAFGKNIFELQKKFQNLKIACHC